MDEEEEESERQLQALESVAMNSPSGANFITNALVKFARIQMALSRRAHNQTRHAIRLTWAIVLLTSALLSFTIYLSYDAYLKNKRIDQTHSNTSEKQKTDTQFAHVLRCLSEP